MAIQQHRGRAKTHLTQTCNVSQTVVPYTFAMNMQSLDINALHVSEREDNTASSVNYWRTNPHG